MNGVSRVLLAESGHPLLQWPWMALASMALSSPPFYFHVPGKGESSLGECGKLAVASKIETWMLKILNKVIFIVFPVMPENIAKGRLFVLFIRHETMGLQVRITASTCLKPLWWSPYPPAVLCRCRAPAYPPENRAWAPRGASWLSPVRAIFLLRWFFGPNVIHAQCVK